MAQQAKSGDTVRVHYTGRLENGSVFDSSRDRDPIEFQLGGGRVIPGFEQAVEGMEVGETREARIPVDDAYGERRDDLQVEVSKAKLPEGVEPEPGQRLTVEVAPGRQGIAEITEVGDENITLDLNHPLAGQPLIFDLELVSIGD